MTTYNRIIEDNVIMKKNPIIALIKEILVELKEEFEEEYDILTEDGPIVFDFCVLKYNLMIDSALHTYGQKSLYCVQNGVHYIVCGREDKRFLKKKIKAWIAYVKDPEKNRMPLEEELENNNE